MLRSDITQITAHYWNAVYAYKGFVAAQMPTAVAKCRTLVEKGSISE